MTIDVQRPWWSEPAKMALLGLLSMFVVIGLRVFSTDRPTLASSSASISDVQNQVDAVDEREKALSRRIDQLQSSLNDLQARLKQRESLETVPRNTSPLSSVLELDAADLGDDPGSVEEILRRCWAYIAKGRFESEQHDAILTDVVRAYAVKGLSPELNRSLLSAIQQVNEIGVRHVITDVRGLPAMEAKQALQAFLDRTPQLTAAQRQRINSALAIRGK